MAIRGRRADDEGEAGLPVRVRHHARRQHLRQRAAAGLRRRSSSSRTRPSSSQKIPFYASLGNHDDPTQRFYKPFNMNGERFYTFKKGDARFFALDSNYMDQPQLKWLEEQLSRSNDRWKIAFFHHPLYSSGARHGSEVDLRTRLEPLFIKYGVDVVFAGHEHFYERHRAAEGHLLLHARRLREAARGQHPHNGPMTAVGFDIDNVVHGGRTRQGLHAVSDGLPHRQASGFGLAATDARAEAVRRQIPIAMSRGLYGSFSCRPDGWSRRRVVHHARRARGRSSTTVRARLKRRRPAPLEQLWNEPQDLERRNLLWGSAPAAQAPSKDVEYTVSKRDETGYSKGYDVVGPDGREWDIKVGKEAQTEIVVSRILLGPRLSPARGLLRDRMEAGGHVGGRRRARALPSAVGSRKRGRMGVARQPVQRRAGRSTASSPSICC